MLFYCRKRAQNNISYVTVMPCSPPADFLFFTVCCVSIYTCRLLAPRRRLLPLCLCTQPVRVMDLKKKKIARQKSMRVETQECGWHTKKTSIAWAETWNRKNHTAGERADGKGWAQSLNPDLYCWHTLWRLYSCTQLHYVRIAWFGLMIFPSVYTWLSRTGFSSCVFSQDQVKMRLINMLMMK